jgi:hypothetical protein
MTTTAELSEKNQEAQKKSRESFWKRKHFFFNLILNFFVTFVLLAVILAWLPYFGPRIETVLFPSVKRIDLLQKEMTVLVAKLDELSHQVQSHKEQLSDLTNIKSQVVVFGETLNTYSNSLNDLTDRFEKFKHNTPQGQINFLKDGLSQLQQRIDKGEAFSDILHGLISKVGSDKLAIDTIHQLTVYANAPTKTASVLAADLQTVCDHLKVVKEESKSVTSENKGLWSRFVSKFYDLIHIRKLGDEEKKPEVTQLDLDNISSTVKEIIMNLSQQNLSRALESGRVLAGRYKGIFSLWLQDLETRKSLEDAFSLFKNKVEPLISRSA